MTTPTVTRDMPRPGADSNAKRAAKVADLIVEDVMALGWPVGEVLGSEADLLERYQVSRAVFREAVRLVEHQQVARTRRGPGGGLVITEPTVGAVIDAVVLYLHRVDARLDEIFEARIILEEIACQLASERTDENDLAELRHFAENDPVEPGSDPRELHALLGAISRNAGLELFIDVFNRVAQLYSPDWQRFGSGVAKETRHAHAMIAEAVMAGDGGLGPQPHAQAPAGRGRLLPPPPLDPPAPARLGRPLPVRPGQGRRDRGAQHHPSHRHRGIAARGARGDRARAHRARGGQPRPPARGGAAARAPSDRAHAPGAGRRALRHGAEHECGHRGGRHLPGAARHAARRAGRAADRCRGGHHRPGGGAHRRRGDGGAPRVR